MFRLAAALASLVLVQHGALERPRQRVEPGRPLIESRERTRALLHGGGWT